MRQRCVLYSRPCNQNASRTHFHFEAPLGRHPFQTWWCSLEKWFPSVFVWKTPVLDKQWHVQTKGYHSGVMGKYLMIYAVAMINFQNRPISKIFIEILHVLFHLHEILQEKKVMYVEKNQNSICPLRVRMGLFKVR